MAVYRYKDNPVIAPADVTPSRDDFEVVGVFNAGVARVGMEVVLLLRVAERPVHKSESVVLTGIYDTSERRVILKDFPRSDPNIDFTDPRLIVTAEGTYLTSISHLRVARSGDGVNFEIERKPAIAGMDEYETFGVEDPRISFVDGVYYIQYVGVSPRGVVTCLASTRDFRSFERLGVIFCPENKDVAIIPERIDGKYYALHRPASPLFRRNDIWIAESPDLMCWGNHRHLMGLRPGRWDETRIGAGAVPFEIEQGWLEVYHGADANNRYCLGAVLLDATEPWKVISRSNEPIFEPEAPYECEGFFGDVVFTCGLLPEEARLKVYYGASDTSICYAEIPLSDAVASLNL